MYTHPLVDLLKSFSKKEIMWFSKFLKSPYFNNRIRILRLFQILKKFYPEFDGKKLTKHNIYKLLYGNAKYNDSTFRNLMSDLLQLAKQFLKIEGMEKNDLQANFFLTEELFSRGSYKLFKDQLHTAENTLKNISNIDGDYFLHNYKINTDSFYVNLLTQKVLKKNYVMSESDKMIKGISFIVCFFVVESIKHNDNLLKYSRTYNIKKNIDIVRQFAEMFNFEKLISFVKNNSGLDFPILELYYKLLQAFTYLSNEKLYSEFKEALISNSHNLGTNDNSFLFSRLIDYCIVKLNLGMHSSFDLNLEIHELNKIFIRNEYFKTTTNKYLSFDFYRNVLLNCITVNKLQYMEEFIKRYHKYLLPKHMISVENYSYSLLYFVKKDYSKALDYINKIKFDQFVYKLDMKNLQLKINYELNHLESVLSVIDTYKHFLKNNILISESRRIQHQNFILFANQIVQYRTGSKKVNLQYLAQKLESSKSTFDKVWLMEKVKGLNRRVSDFKVAGIITVANSLISFI